MAVTFRSKAEVITTATGNTTVTEPASAASGDVLIALALADSDGATQLAAPAGWTNLYGPAINGATRYVVSYIQRGGSAPNLTWTVSGTSKYREVQVLCLTGAAAVTLDSQSSAGATGNATLTAHPPDPPATTAVASSSLAVSGGYHFDGSSGSVWSETSYTVRTRNTLGDDSVMATRSLAASGSENPAAYASGTNPATADYWDGFTVTFTDVAATVTDAWTQPTAGTGSLQMRAAALRRSAIGAQSSLQGAGFIDGPLPTQPDTYTQPVQGTRALMTSARQLFGRATSTTGQRTGVDSSPVGVAAEPDTWAQPVPGTTLLARGVRDRWARAVRPAPFGDFVDGPLPTQPDLYLQPTPGTASVQRTATAFWHRAARPKLHEAFVDGPLTVQPDTYSQPVQGTRALAASLRQMVARVVLTRAWRERTAVDDSVVAEPDPYIQPVQGTASLGQVARTRALRASRAVPFGSHLDGVLPTQPDTYVQPTQGTRSLRRLWRESWDRVASTLGWRTRRYPGDDGASTAVAFTFGHRSGPIGDADADRAGVITGGAAHRSGPIVPGAGEGRGEPIGPGGTHGRSGPFVHGTPKRTM